MTLADDELNLPSEPQKAYALRECSLILRKKEERKKERKKNLFAQNASQ